MKSIRVLVADDEGVLRDGVVTILSLQQDIKVVGEAENGEQAIQLARQLKPDVILLDNKMPKKTGLEAIPILKEVSPDSKILILTGFDESDAAYRAVRAGALGFLLKDVRRNQLLEAIHQVAAGEAVMPPNIAMRVIQEMDNPTEMMYTADPLTPRENETLRLIASGLSNQEIADRMTVHPRTVAKYVSSILDKLHLANRTQAALYALNEGLADSKKEPRRKK